MVWNRLLGLGGSTLLVIGALAIGWALHVSVVTGRVPAIAPGPVLAGIGGVLAVALGYALERRFEPKRILEGATEDEEEATEPTSPLTDVPEESADERNH
ncbi:MAG: hypothetical protein ABEJ77_06705 [Halanaeroarchaeum sp.]